MNAKIQKLPPEVATLGDELAKLDAELAKNAADRARAEAAVTEAEYLNDELENVTRIRAEARARAFVDGAAPDLAELDNQLEHLEMASRAAREDGTAAELAIALLDTKRGALEAAKATKDAERKRVVVTWLGARREAAIKRYLEAIAALEPIVTEASACDRVQNMLAKTQGGVGLALLNGAKTCDFAIPKLLWSTVNNQAWRPPVPWLTAHFDSGQSQDEVMVGELVKLLRDAGVLP